MDQHILMLEDNPDRLAHFIPVVAEMKAAPTLLHWRDALRMIREVPPFLPTAVLICLDHDLDPLPGHDDPGDGLMVARFLAPLRPACPILIHTSNADGARRMRGEFELHGGNVHTILPWGEAWIENYWRAKVETLLAPL